MTTGRSRKPRKPKALTKPSLERMAIRYLERFPASEAHFRRVMQRQIKRAHERAPGDESEYGPWLGEVEEMCRRIGLLNDRQLCGALAASFGRRGYSLKDIRRRLQHKGFSRDVIDVSIDTHIENLERASTLRRPCCTSLRQEKAYGPICKASY